MRYALTNRGTFESIYIRILRVEGRVRNEGPGGQDLTIIS